MTPLFKKLNFKHSTDIFAINSPQSFESELIKMAEFATVYKEERYIRY